jgi:UDP:flavonoid glycosyltransferase YjiC (YdhE family)
MVKVKEGDRRIKKLELRYLALSCVMSQIVLTTIGSLGDLHPLIAIGLGLRERGHNVVFATIKDYRSKIESLGFEFHALRPDYIAMDDPEMITRMMDIQKGTERVVRDYLLANLRDTYTDLMNAAQKADFIVTNEIVYAARIVAEKLRIRWAFCALAPGSFFSAYDPFVLPPFPALAKLRSFGPAVNRQVMNFAKFVTRSWGEPIYQLRRELGLPPVGNPIVDDKFSPYLVLALFSSVLGAPQPDWAANTVVTGFPFYDGNQPTGLVPKLKQFLDAGEPPIIFTLGSAAVLSPGNFYQESIETTKQLNRRAVLLIGKNQSPENLPESVVAFDYAPYSEIFPHAGAVVHQGGVGTTAQALRAGCPTLIVPYSHDQPDNAARVERLGTSRTIPRKQYSASRATKELRELLNNPRYTARAAEIGRIVQAENGVRVACDEIEKQLTEASILR